MTLRVPIRVLVADGSATARRALASMLAEDPGVQVVGEACDGLEAVALCRALLPDVVTMDAQMPGLDGLRATEAIMELSPARVLLVCAASESEQLDLGFRAVAAGALELVARPAGDDVELRAWGRRIMETIRLMAEVPVVRRSRSPAGGAPASPPQAWREAAPRPEPLLAIGLVASTGGPPALARILGSLPARFGVPVLVAQHVAPGFTAGLRRWLAEATPLPVRIATDREPLGPGVWLAPDHRDLCLDAGGLLRTPFAATANSPSGDVLLRSLAPLGSRALGLVLTGMGDDGAQGLLALRRGGGRAFAQDQASSSVFGMPQAAFALGAAQDLLALDRIAPLILELA